MPKEIERKFLVRGEFKKYALKNTIIKQGYLSNDPERTVRVRIKGQKGYLTVKGKSEGISRFEWEKELDKNEAEDLLKLCYKPLIEKRRYFIEYRGFVYEVDEFLNDNTGLVIAEIELDSPEQHFEKPEWLGEELSGDIRFFNSYLSKNAFKNWRDRKKYIYNGE